MIWLLAAFTLISCYIVWPRDSTLPAVAWFLRHLVRWLHRRRYAATAGRISALELELGMREPTQTERAFQALGNAASAGELAMQRLKLLADHDAVRVTQRASGGGRNYYAGGDITIREHPPYATALHEWSGNKQCPQCARMLAAEQLAGRAGE